MNFNDLLQKKITEITKREQILAAFLVGSTVDVKDYNVRINDIDIFMIINNKNHFEREIKLEHKIKLDISYIPLSLFRQGLNEQWPFLINSFSKFKIIFCLNHEVVEIAERLKRIFTDGPGLLTSEEKDYIRFKLNEDFENLLSKKSDLLNFHFLAHNLFTAILSFYFPLNGKWTPKGKKILDEIRIEDNILYNLCESFINQGQLEEKTEILSKMIQYVLENFGGTKKYWERGKFPLK